jgi:hypothetical protein
MDKISIVELMLFLSLIPSFLQAVMCLSLRPSSNRRQILRSRHVLQDYPSSRRDVLASTVVGTLSFLAILESSPLSASAVADCFQDCVKNCKKVAPKDPEYCLANCKDYCELDDRTDGLSGSVSAATGEVGILGGTFGQGTVPNGEDRVSQLDKFLNVKFGMYP